MYDCIYCMYVFLYVRIIVWLYLLYDCIYCLYVLLYDCMYVLLYVRIIQVVWLYGCMFSSSCMFYCIVCTFVENGYLLDDYSFTVCNSSTR